MGSYATLIRGRLQHKYHFCSCCSIRYPLSQLQWQVRDKGAGLYCTQCFDTMVGPERTAQIDRMSAIAATSNELQPDPKITDAALVIDDEVDFMP